jgi:hypothetical protein
MARIDAIAHPAPAIDHHFFEFRGFDDKATEGSQQRAFKITAATPNLDHETAHIDQRCNERSGGAGWIKAEPLKDKRQHGAGDRFECDGATDRTGVFGSPEISLCSDTACTSVFCEVSRTKNRVDRLPGALNAPNAFKRLLNAPPRIPVLTEISRKLTKYAALAGSCAV